jgi:hypothetical protein
MVIELFYFIFIILLLSRLSKTKILEDVSKFIFLIFNMFNIIYLLKIIILDRAIASIFLFNLWSKWDLITI